ncbi:hypothetical protein [Geobacillus thermoleovorans]|uniref:hypothetical protein n=1 Tax=Geobacillus thermoleovorans TaxID=33941 RepID=UPI000A8D15FB|nr:hypothetical protein [Geobacillus thermoleovorans]
MKWVFISRMASRLKAEAIFILVFSGALMFDCLNPHTINPAEWILYTKYLVPIGMAVWLLFSFRLHLSLFASMPIHWIAMNDIIRNPQKIVFCQALIAFVCFFVLQMALAGIIAGAVVINYSAGWDLFAFLFPLYVIHFLLPFLWAWMIGLSTSAVYAYHSPKKAMLLVGVLVLWIIVLFSLEYRNPSFSLWVNHRWPYIDPLFSLTFQKERMLIKLAYILSSIAVYGVFRSMRRSFAGLAASAIFLTVATSFLQHAQSKFQLDDILLANDVKLYQQIKHQDQTKNIPLNGYWKIKEIEVNPKSTYPIKVTLSLHPKERTVRFSINEQFQIDHIQGGGKRLPFQQQGNVVQVETNGAPSMTIYYRHTFGSTFYPLTSGVTLLPFEANWYPQPVDSKLYYIDSSGTLHSNVETKTCTRVKMIVGKEKYRWRGDHPLCLSMINGPYKQIQVQHTRFLVYKPFLTTARNYMELKRQLVSIRNELCHVFPDLANIDYCTKEVKSVSIIPKSINTTNLSLYDSTVADGNYTFYIDPFLDVNGSPATKHIQELAAFFIPYRLFENERIGLFAGLYLMEKLHIPGSSPQVVLDHLR